MGFDKNAINVRTGDGHNITLLEDLTYTAASGEVFTVPIGSTSDGASVPRELWNIFPPFGPYWLAAVFHDWLYRFSSVAKDRCDSLLLEAMLSLGVPQIDARTIYDAVKLFGAGSFNADRRQPATAP